MYPNRYCIIEHDHKYVSERNPAIYKNFIAPPQSIVNKDFYKSAKYVFCQSVKHTEVLSKNLNIDNVINLGCSLWTKDQIEFLKQNCTNDKNKKHFVLGDLNPIKGLKEAKDLCVKKGVDFDVVEKQPYPDFIKQLSQYDKLVFLPKTLESFCRIILEARMLNCGIVTNNLNGCTYEPWFKKYKGIELINFVDNKREEIISTIQEKIFEVQESD